MHIKIAERLRPFTHLPGNYIPLPGSVLRLQIFPALIRVHDLSKNTPVLLTELKLNVQGPLKDFTVELDLENGSVKVWGMSENGFIRYKIVACNTPDRFTILPEKGNPEIFNTIPQNLSNQKKELFKAPGTERLSLGNHKSQDWAMVLRRQNFMEIFPAWMRLGALIPPQANQHFCGTAALLEECLSCISNNSREKILAAFQRLFLSGFEGILSPRLSDEDFHGIMKESFLMDSHCTPLLLLENGAALIRRLFFKEKEKKIFLLPCLPPEFHCGRFLHVQCAELGLLDMEWSKGLIRRMILTAEHSAVTEFHFQKELKRFRFREGYKDRGQIITAPSPLALEKGKIYFFDHFEK